MYNVVSHQMPRITRRFPNYYRGGSSSEIRGRKPEKSALVICFKNWPEYLFSKLIVVLKFVSVVISAINCCHCHHYHHHCHHHYKLQPLGIQKLVLQQQHQGALGIQR